MPAVAKKGTSSVFPEHPGVADVLIPRANQGARHPDLTAPLRFHPLYRENSKSAFSYHLERL